mgnify:CR=1 FL=1
MLFEGHVQGVGFRFSAAEIARNFSVSGYVMNRPDGAVELVAEGDEQVLLQFRSALLASHLSRYIRRAQTNWLPPTHSFQTFEIRYA